VASGKGKRKQTVTIGTGTTALKAVYRRKR
jgi:hypothetical protein